MIKAIYGLILILAVAAVALGEPPQDPSLVATSTGETITYENRVVDPDELLKALGRKMGLRTSGTPDQVEITVVLDLSEQRVDLHFPQRRLTSEERLQLDNVIKALPVIEGGADGFRKHVAAKKKALQERYAAAKTEAERARLLAEHMGLVESQ
jgi:hypothetical protein